MSLLDALFPRHDPSQREQISRRLAGQATPSLLVSRDSLMSLEEISNALDLPPRRNGSRSVTRRQLVNVLEAACQLSDSFLNDSDDESDHNEMSN